MWLFSRRWRRENAASCIISQRILFVVIVVWGSSAIISVICERNMGFFLMQLIEYSYVVFSRRLRRSRRENAAGCIISQRKTVCKVIVAFGVCLRKSEVSAGKLK